ncbi:MAG: hypothetical protein NVS4B8_00980 [Herpetosiphon sp.]
MSNLQHDIRQRLALDISPEQYRTIRALWIDHSRAEDARDLQGLVDTLAPDCVYHVVPTGQRWEGHDGARTFYTSFLGAFPDVHFDLTDIVIGPQGVFEVATMSGTHQGRWAGLEPAGQHIEMPILIHFPWNQAAQKFAGENVYYDGLSLVQQIQRHS